MNSIWSDEGMAQVSVKRVNADEVITVCFCIIIKTVENCASKEVREFAQDRQHHLSRWRSLTDKANYWRHSSRNVEGKHTLPKRSRPCRLLSQRQIRAYAFWMRYTLHISEAFCPTTICDRKVYRYERI